MTDARTAAVRVLLRVENGGYSNLTLDSEISSAGLQKNDAALMTAIVLGVIKRKITLDRYISQFSKKSTKLASLVRQALRIGIYQIIFMDKIPVSAAVNESVKIVKASKERHSAGFVNAVLRAVAKNGPIDENELSAEEKFSCPTALKNKLTADYGEEFTYKFLEESLKIPPEFIRVNTTKTNEDELIDLLTKEGIKAKKTVVQNALAVSGVGNIERSKLFCDGYFYVQDISSQLCALSLDAKEGERVLDVCAAPGGKSFTIASQMGLKGEVVSCDLYDQRVSLISSGAERLGLSNIITKTADATVFDETLGMFDRILCDVPCSGFGVIRRKPEIKYKDLDSIKELYDIQYKILCNASRYLKKGGRLVYSTCTLNKIENEKAVARFLAENEGFEAEKIQIGSSLQECFTLSPRDFNNDGFFIAGIRKR